MLPVVEYVAKLKPIEYQFYVELGQTDSPLQFAHTYRFCYNESGSLSNGFMESILSTLEEMGMPPYLLAALDNDRIHYLMLNYSLIVAEEIARTMNYE
jgi:hypothetical protein